MKIKTCYASLMPLYDKIDAYIDLLPDNLKRRILNISDINAKVCSLGGALLLDIAAKEFGADAGDVVYSSEGKPYIPESDFYFSISHTKGYAALSFGKTLSGCDIQIKKDINIKIAERIFTEKEIKSIRENNNAEEEFFRIWCRKESVFKLSGGHSCTETNEGNYAFMDCKLNNDLFLCVCTTDGEILNPVQLDFDTVL